MSAQYPIFDNALIAHSLPSMHLINICIHCHPDFFLSGTSLHSRITDMGTLKFIYKIPPLHTRNVYFRTMLWKIYLSVYSILSRDIWLRTPSYFFICNSLVGYVGCKAFQGHISLWTWIPYCHHPSLRLIAAKGLSRELCHHYW